MSEINFKYYHSRLLVSSILILGTIINYFISYLTNNFNWSKYISFPSTGIIVFALLIIINRYLWKIKPFSYLLWIKDFSGRYKGFIEYVNPKTNSKEKKNCFIEIEQNASFININTYFDFKSKTKKEKTYSSSKISTITKDNFGNLEIVFNYQNNGNSIMNIAPSNGTNILRIIESGKAFHLDGIYYTDRIPQTKGIIKANFLTKKLKKRF